MVGVILEERDRSIMDLVVPVVTDDVGEISAEAVRVPFVLMTWDRFPLRF